MDSSPPMLQVYRDDEHASVAAPLVPINQYAEVTHPRWAKQSRKSKNVVRGAIATGAFIATYLFFCAWVAFANNGSLVQRGDSTAFPHRRFPWPFPGRGHPHPHPHPHHPHPNVLGCAAIPTPSADGAEISTNAELNVTLPGCAPVLLGDMLLHGDISVIKVNQSEAPTMSVNRTMLVGIKVANRTMRHPPPPDAEEEPESTPESFVLCAIQFRMGPPPPPPPSPPPPPMGVDAEQQSALASSEQPHPHPHPPHHPPHRGHPPPPVIVAIFPALNATYPKFPGPHGPPPPHGPPGTPGEAEPVEVASSDSMLVAAWKSTVSFLFPMLSAFPHHPRHGPPCHHRPPPPPPFWVTALEVTLPKYTRVLFGHGPPPHRGPWH